MSLDSTTSWGAEKGRNHWNEWVKRDGRDTVMGREPLRRGETVISLLKGCNLQQPHMLELGCSHGWFAEKLAAFGPVTGVDIADDAIEQARRRVPSGTFYASDLPDIDLPLETFDVVITLETISEVSNQRGFVELAARVLKQPGYLILTVPNQTVYSRRSQTRPPAHGRFTGRSQCLSCGGCSGHTFAF
jgi:2-polyprenyl-3-methyl-5-hydroxy-6-metoxy-1,4-benzoquinol methylase